MKYTSISRNLILTLIAFIVLVLFITFAVSNLLKTIAELNKVKTEVKQLERKLAILESNKTLTHLQIDQYNSLLTQLIPDREDYFSMLFALEQLSQQTGFIITKYSIHLKDSSPEKINVTVDGDGDTDAFLKFLEDYKFAGGRLITNERIEFSSERIGQIRLTLNFYNKSVNTSTEDIRSLSPTQIDLMREIQSKTVIVFKDEPDTIEEYSTKSNPF